MTDHVARHAGLDLTPRQRVFWAMYDFSVGRGLEIGPLHQCIAAREHSDVAYVDVVDRAGLLDHYGNDPAIAPEQIPEIEFPLFDGERVRSIPEAVGEHGGVDWVVASHVAEHVPDLVGWLAQLAEVTRDGGDLVLAIPDRRYCFDAHRPATSVGQLIQAHESGDVIPSVRAVYDSFRSYVAAKAPSLWAGDTIDYDRRLHALPDVLEQVARARNGEYVDCHVWTFTPGSFLEAVRDLRAVGLCQWTVRTLVPTPVDQLEFYAILTRLPRSGDWPEALLADEPQPGRMPDWLLADADARAGLQREIDELRRAAQDRADAAERRAERHRATLEELLARDRRRVSSRIKAAVRRSPIGGQAGRVYRRLRRTPPRAE